MTVLAVSARPGSSSSMTIPSSATAWPGCSRPCPRSRSSAPAGTAEEAFAVLSGHARRRANGHQLARRFRRRGDTARHPDRPRAGAVFVISMVDDDDSVFAALAAGARGYVLKGATAAGITAALRTVAAGGAVFGAGIASRMLATVNASRPARGSGPDRLPPHDDLTARGTRGTRLAGRRGQQPPDAPDPSGSPSRPCKTTSPASWTSFRRRTGPRPSCAPEASRRPRG